MKRFLALTMTAKSDGFAGACRVVAEASWAVSS
jgi:hypothetical protein